MPEWLIWIIAGLVVFELGEHVVFPLIWSLVQRKRRTPDPLADLVGARVRVAAWSQGRGQVYVGRERWLARGPVDLVAGEEVVVGGLQGMTLSVKRIDAGSK